MSRRTLLLGAATWGAVGLHTAWRHRPPQRGRLRVVSWNLRNFNGRSEATSEHALGHDTRKLRAHFAALDADVFAFQEVLEPEALDVLLPAYTLAASTVGGAHGQHLVIARRRSISAMPARTHLCTALSDRLRPVLHQQVTLPSGAMSVVVVHLKASRAGYDLRRAQRGRLLQFLGTIPRPRLVVGDFNTTGAPGGSASAEIASLTADLAAIDLQRLQPSAPCSAYWEGRRFDRFKVPSTLDHMFADRAGPLAPPVQLAPGLHCARARCEPLISTDAYPDLDYERASDHCPLLLDVFPKTVVS